VRLSDRRLLAALLGALRVSEEQAGTVYRVFDKLRRTPEEVSVRRLADAGLGTGTVDRLLALARSRTWEELSAVDPGLAGALGQGDSLRRTLDALRAMQLGDYLDLDLGIVRGLDYYTGTVFELFDAKGELRALCGGGRYDDLLQSLGGVDLPALGFGMGDVVLSELLRDRGLAPPAEPTVDVFLVAISQDDIAEVLGLARELRDAELRTEYALAPQAVGKQLKLADTRGARVAIVVGPDDRARGEVMVKDLRGKGQVAVARPSVRDYVARLVGDEQSPP
jgi:histidyl-tRNA synthetase